MAAGTVVIADDGSETTKTGAAGRLYDILMTTVGAAMEGGVPSGPDGAATKQGQADVSNAFASWLVTELTVQTAATVTAGGLQKTPNPNDPDTATAAPAAPVAVPLTHTT